MTFSELLGKAVDEGWTYQRFVNAVMRLDQAELEQPIPSLILALNKGTENMVQRRFGDRGGKAPSGDTR